MTPEKLADYIIEGFSAYGGSPHMVDTDELYHINQLVNYLAEAESYAFNPETPEADMPPDQAFLVKLYEKLSKFIEDNDPSHPLNERNVP